MNLPFRTSLKLKGEPIWDKIRWKKAFQIGCKFLNLQPIWKSSSSCFKFKNLKTKDFLELKGCFSKRTSIWEPKFVLKEQFWNWKQLTGEKGFEPLTFGFGDHYSTIETILLVSHQNDVWIVFPNRKNWKKSFLS